MNGSRGRHGRAPAQESAGDAAARRRLVRLAVLPATVVICTAAALLAYVTAAADGGAAFSPAGSAGVCAVALTVACAAVGAGAWSAAVEARCAVERYTALRCAVARSQAEIRTVLRGLEQGEHPGPRTQAPPPEPPRSADTLQLLAHELTLAQHTAEAAVAQSVALVRGGPGGSEEKVEVFVNLARRLQSLVHREIELLDELENEVEDPDLLKGLFHVDHLATRIRRHAENLAVLGGAVARRQWTRPVTTTEVLRSSIAEVEQYPRVKLVPPIEGTLRGHAVADVIHLLAELVENATVYSAPHTGVLLRAQYVTAGLALEVEDRGLGMTAAEQDRMNALLSDPRRIDVGELLSDGRIGLFVVSALAKRHGIVVQLQSNIYGGVQAVLVLPRELLGDEQPDAAARQGAVTGARVPSSVPLRTERVPAGTAESVERPDRPEPPEPVEPVTPATAPARATTARTAAPRPQGPAAERSAASPSPSPPPPPAAARREGPGPGVPNSARPQLPKRRRQQHIVPELREPPRYRGADPADDPDGAERGHDPGLMAAFQRGLRLAEDSDGAAPEPRDRADGAGAPSAPAADASFPAGGGEASRTPR